MADPAVPQDPINVPDNPETTDNIEDLNLGDGFDESCCFRHGNARVFSGSFSVKITWPCDPNFSYGRFESGSCRGEILCSVRRW